MFALLAVPFMAAGCGSSVVQITPKTVPTQTTQSTSSPASQASTYTMAQVEAANSATKCWTSINGNVYDLTSFINKHPGGASKILSLCGTDGTSAFTDQHGGEKRPANELAGLKIGVLAQ